MKVQIIDIPYALKNYISKIWFFDKNSDLSENEDMRLVAPNGLIRLVIPFKNELSLRNGKWSHVIKEERMILIGIRDLPIFVDFAKNKTFAMLGVEFTPFGAYRFFHFRQSEIKNNSYFLTDIMDKNSLEIEDQIANTENINLKVEMLMQFLLNLFKKKDSDLIFEHCISKIIYAKGNISVNQLANETGYSSRWLNMKFDERLGLSPKNTSSIFRFHHFYAAILRKDESILRDKAFLDAYYDQSHFIKDFKRYTGLTPTEFEARSDSFISLFYTK